MANATPTNSPGAFLQLIKSPDIQFAMGLVAIIFVMITPLPPLLLDILLCISITIGFLILLVAIYVKEPLEFSTFPTVLLLSTLFRLALNIATTRSILLDGASGQVSSVVRSFGQFVVGGNYFCRFCDFCDSRNYQLYRYHQGCWPRRGSWR